MTYPGWLQWVPASTASLQNIGMLLCEFAAVHPGRPLLIQSPHIRLRPVDAQELARSANELPGPTALSVLSNADPGLNPFAGLDTSGCTDAANSKLLERTAGLVNLLGSGDLHPWASGHNTCCI